MELAVRRQRRRWTGRRLIVQDDNVPRWPPLACRHHPPPAAVGRPGARLLRVV